MRPQNTLFLLVLLVVFSSAVLAEQTNPNDSQTAVQQTGVVNRPIDLDAIPYFLNEYPEFSGYSITRKDKQGSLEAVYYQRGEFESADFSSVVLNNLVLLNPNAFDAVIESIFRRWTGGFETFEMDGKGPFYRNAGANDNDASKQRILLWNSGYRIVSFQYQGVYPQEIIDKYLELLPIEPFPVEEEKVQYTPEQKVMFLYTSNNFEAPENLIDYVILGKEGVAPCFLPQLNRDPQTDQEYEQLVIDITTSRKYPLTESEKQRMINECKTQGSFSIPPIEPPFDIQVCKNRFEQELQQADLEPDIVSILKECIIEAYSKEKWMSSGKSATEFDQLVQERIPKVIELLSTELPPVRNCSDGPDGTEICDEPSPREGTFITLDPNFVIEKFHFVETWEGIPIDAPGAMETQVIVNGQYKNVFVVGNEVWSSTPLQVRNGKTYLGPIELNVLPEMDSSPVEGKEIHETKVVEENGEKIVEVKTIESGKILSLFSVQMPVQFKINTVTKQTKVEKPWWSFLFA